MEPLPQNHHLHSRLPSSHPSCSFQTLIIMKLHYLLQHPSNTEPDALPWPSASVDTPWHQQSLVYYGLAREPNRAHPPRLPLLHMPWKRDTQSQTLNWQVRNLNRHAKCKIGSNICICCQDLFCLSVEWGTITTSTQQHQMPSTSYCCRDD